MSELQLGPRTCRYCTAELPITGTKTVDVDGTTIRTRARGRPRVQCGSDNCVREMWRESRSRNRARRAMAA